MEHVAIRGFDKEIEDYDKESNSIKKEINSNNSNKDHE